jgi:hypothetical protein
MRVRAGAGRRRAGIAALAAAALALGLLLARILQASHFLLVPHAVCAHGELTHADPVSSADPAPAASGERADPAPAEALADHDHCDASALHHRPLEIRASLAPPGLLVLPAPREPASVAERRPVALLLLAPKGSPPAA